MTAETDRRYFGRVYRASAVLWLLGLAACVCAGSLLAAVGWTVGAAVSALTLCSLEYVIRRNFVPGNPRAGSALARFSVVKLVVVGLIISALVIAGGRSAALVGAFCAGVVLTQLVMVGREVGIGGTRG